MYHVWDHTLPPTQPCGAPYNYTLNHLPVLLYWQGLWCCAVGDHDKWGHSTEELSSERSGCTGSKWNTAASQVRTSISNFRVFSRNILKGGHNIGVRAGGRGVLWVYYILENMITANQDFEETKGYSPGCFFWGPKKCAEKSNPSESKRKEKLNGACFSCIAHVSTEL